MKIDPWRCVIDADHSIRVSEGVIVRCYDAPMMPLPKAGMQTRKAWDLAVLIRGGKFG
jgi:hypothetical protein